MTDRRPFDTDEEESQIVSRRVFLAGGVAVVAALGGGAAVVTRGLVTAQDGTPADPDGSPSPEASPEGSPSPTAGEVTIEMGDIFFDPSRVTIEADTDVTIALPNNGAAPHNFNIDDNNNESDPDIHSGDVSPGDSTTVTVNLAAGDWYFYCSIPGHEAAGMHGTITAE
jgi:nitrite reductase (NO-forming)